jgi:hypothetical protein
VAVKKPITPAAKPAAPAPRPAAPAARPAAGPPSPISLPVAKKTVTPTVSRPVPAPSIATRPTPQQTATARMSGTADAREVAATARAYGITPAQARSKISGETAAQLAMQGTKSSRPTGMSADRMEESQIMKIYGVDRATARKISNTQVDTIRGSQGQKPIFSPNQKTAIPKPLVGSSGPGSIAAGWQSTGPVSSVTGLPLGPVRTTTTRRPSGGGGVAQPVGDGGGGGGAVEEEEELGGGQTFFPSYAVPSQFIGGENEQNFSPIADRTVRQQFGSAPTVRQVMPNVFNIFSRFGQQPRGRFY